MAEPARKLDWRSRRLWQAIGYGATAAWMFAIVVITGNDVSHPLFRYIFIVPLGGWILGLVVARLIQSRRPPDRVG